MIASQAEHSDVIEILRKESIEPNQDTIDIKDTLLDKNGKHEFSKLPLINFFKNIIFLRSVISYASKKHTHVNLVLFDIHTADPI